MANGDRLTLRQAREAGRLIEFVAQAEREQKKNRKPVSLDEYDAILRVAVKSEKAKRRTSGSRARGGSSGKRLR